MVAWPAAAGKLHLAGRAVSARLSRPHGDEVAGGAEERVQHVLVKLARQLLAFDEASLMSLWEDYARRVTAFEPSRRWEEAVIVLNLIQAVRFKNQLFNHHWAEGQGAGHAAQRRPVLAPAPEAVKPDAAKSEADQRGRGKVITLRPKPEEES